MTEEPTPITTIRPLYDHILVKRLEAEAQSPGGIIIPDNAKEKPVEGLVVAVGDGALNRNGTRRSPEVKAGDRVLFAKYSGTEYKVDEVEYLILSEKDILGVIQD